MYVEDAKKKPKPATEQPPTKPGKRETGRGVRHPHPGQTRSMPVKAQFMEMAPAEREKWKDEYRGR